MSEKDQIVMGIGRVLQVKCKLEAVLVRNNPVMDDSACPRAVATIIHRCSPGVLADADTRIVGL